MKTSHGLKVCPFAPVHLDMMVMRDREAAATVEHWKTLCSQLPTEAVHTYYINGLILCVAGYVQVSESNIEVFVIPSVHVYLYPVAFQSNVKRQLDEWQESYDRIQTHSHDDDQTSDWMESLGFELEGLHPKYCRGLTYRTWARVK